jgi:hypothetical protein
MYGDGTRNGKGMGLGVGIGCSFTFTWVRFVHDLFWNGRLQDGWSAGITKHVFFFLPEKREERLKAQVKKYAANHSRVKSPFLLCYPTDTSLIAPWRVTSENNLLHKLKENGPFGLLERN